MQRIILFPLLGDTILYYLKFNKHHMLSYMLFAFYLSLLLFYHYYYLYLSLDFLDSFR